MGSPMFPRLFQDILGYHLEDIQCILHTAPPDQNHVAVAETIRVLPCVSHETLQDITMSQGYPKQWFPMRQTLYQPHPLVNRSELGQSLQNGPHTVPYLRLRQQTQISPRNLEEAVVNIFDKIFSGARHFNSRHGRTVVNGVLSHPSHNQKHVDGGLVGTGVT